MSDSVAVLKLEGGKANSMSSELLERIIQIIDGFERGPARAGVLTGYEKFFSAGLALPLLIDLDRPAMKKAIELFGTAMQRVFACEKPIIAAINGHAIAGGCVLALQCDWRVIADDSSVRIGLNETQLGIGLPSVVIEPLRYAVPPASFVPIALEGRLFSPQEALGLGLVNEVVPATNLLERATAKAQALAELPTAGVAQVKRALRRPAIETIARVSTQETERWLDSWFDPAAKMRITAAVQKLKR
jgi:enoyl-CoA hydratase